MTKMVEAIMDLKNRFMVHITTYPATFHAIDVVSKIVGWEEAAKIDKSIDLSKRFGRYMSRQLVNLINID